MSAVGSAGSAQNYPVQPSRAPPQALTRPVDRDADRAQEARGSQSPTVPASRGSQLNVLV